MNDKVNIEEFDIISDMKPVPDVKEKIFSYSVLLLEAFLLTGLFYAKTDAVTAYILWAVGFIVWLAMTTVQRELKFRKVEGNIFIDSQTHFADDDIYELMVVENVETVVEPLEPFPFAKSCYEEDELAESLARIDAEYLKDEIVKEKLKREMDEILAQVEEDNKRGRLVRWLKRR